MYYILGGDLVIKGLSTRWEMNIILTRRQGEFDYPGSKHS